MTDWVRKGIERARKRADSAHIKEAHQEGDLEIVEKDGPALFEELRDLSAKIVAEYCRELGASAATLHSPRSRQFSIEKPGHSIQLILDGGNVQILTTPPTPSDGKGHRVPSLAIVAHDGVATFAIGKKVATVDEVAQALLQPLLFD